MSRQASSSAAARPPGVAVSLRSSSLRKTKSMRGSAPARSARSASPPRAVMNSMGSMPSGSTTQRRSTVLCSMNWIARSAAFWPAASPSKR